MRLLSCLASLFAGLFWLCASDVTDKRPPWDAIKLVSFNRGDATDRSWLAQTPTTSAGVTFPATYRVADFGGTSTAVISYPDAPELENPPFTLACWIRIDAYTGYRAIASKIAQSGTYNGWHLYYGPSISRGLALGHSNSGLIFRQAWTASGELTAGTWYHVAATLSALNATAVLYVNGVAKSVTTGSGGTVTDMASTELFRIGGKGGTEAGWSYHDGAIDDFRMFSSVLTADQIGQIYAEGIGESRP